MPNRLEVRALLIRDQYTNSPQLPTTPSLSEVPRKSPFSRHPCRPNQLFTTGYAGHDLDSFVNKLRQHGVNTVIDIRQNPVSRKKGFSKSRLSAFLAENGIGYVHVRELGVPRRPATAVGRRSMHFR